MDVALIPPISLLGDTNLTKIQLVLPQLLKYRPEDILDAYSLRYQKLCDDPSQYVIMDNGAAEAALIDIPLLLHKIEIYQPDEFAIPDELGNSENTIMMAWNFFTKYQREIDRINADRYKMGKVDLKLGFVAQGKTVDESINTVLQMLSHTWSSQIKTIYIPRLLVKESGDHLARIKVFKQLQRSLGNQFEYHFFGAAPTWPNEINAIRDYDGIRSIDTSLPYILSYYATALDARFDHVPLARPIDYFSIPGDIFYDVNMYVDFFLGLSR